MSSLTLSQHRRTGKHQGADLSKRIDDTAFQTQKGPVWVFTPTTSSP